MNSLINLIAWILIASGSTVAAEVNVAHPNKPRPADIRIDHEILAEHQPLSLIFLDVLRGTGIHGGFAERTGCSEMLNARLSIKKGSTIRQAMDALVKENRGYKWEMERGVVNLIPRSGVPILRTIIVKFQMNATDQEIPSVLGDLFDVKDVREHAAALGLRPGIGTGGLAAGAIIPVPRQPSPAHINLQNISLQAALNKIVKLSADGVWVYRETSCNGAKTFVVELRSGY